MKVYIKCLNVLDGDSIIVSLVKGESNLVFLIDGGHSGDSGKIISNLNTILAKNNKKNLDFILCTHYDDDHIGGLFNVVKYYGNRINKVWIHQTSAKILLEKIKKIQPNNKTYDSIFPNEYNDYLLPGGINSYANDSNFQELVKSVTQEIEFAELLSVLKIETNEPIAGTFNIEGWPELQLIGPSMEYYKKLFPSHFDIAVRIEDIRANTVPQLTKDSFQNLDSVTRSKVTAPNLNSAILLLKVNNEKILFTGDAGISSFEAIKDFEALLKDLHVLKVPHHASHNNINSELIRLFKPKISLVSGNRHVSELVIKCLKEIDSEIRSTKDSGNDIEFDDELF